MKKYLLLFIIVTLTNIGFSEEQKTIPKLSEILDKGELHHIQPTLSRLRNWKDNDGNARDFNNARIALWVACSNSTRMRNSWRTNHNRDLISRECWEIIDKEVPPR